MKIHLYCKIYHDTLKFCKSRKQRENFQKEITKKIFCVENGKDKEIENAHKEKRIVKRKIVQRKITRKFGKKSYLIKNTYRKKNIEKFFS